MKVTTSDPGSSGSLSPFAKMDGLYFEKTKEPEDGILDLEKEIEIYNKRLKKIEKFTIDYLSDCETVDEKLEREQKMLDIMNQITIKQIHKDGKIINITS